MFEPVLLSGSDPVGVLHTDGGRFLRGIHEPAAAQVRELLQSGLIDELAGRKLFPATRPLEAGTPHELRGYALVLEHEALRPVTYPREWSFGMLKAAALAYLDILEVAGRRGYTLKDAHLFNFLFRGAQPVWVDFGSFLPAGRAPAPLPWLAEFNGGVAGPLRMWAGGSAHAASSAVRHPARQVPYEEFLAYRFPPLRGRSRLAGSARRWLAWTANAASIREDSRRARLFRAVFAGKAHAEIRSLRRNLEPLACPASPWGAYQDEYLDENGGIRPTPRFERILEILARHRPASVVELAGNSGVLSQAIADRFPGTQVLCTDSDPQAIDRLFERMRRAGLPGLAAAVLDFMVPEYTAAEQAPEKRFAGDCVLALAVTHHLLLSQGYGYDSVFERIRAYTRDLAFVEFMPLGLHDGRSAPPLPAWYGLDAFGAAFSRHFERLHTEKLDDNRILLVGRRLPQ